MSLRYPYQLVGIVVTVGKNGVANALRVISKKEIDPSVITAGLSLSGNAPATSLLVSIFLNSEMKGVYDAQKANLASVATYFLIDNDTGKLLETNSALSIGVDVDIGKILQSVNLKRVF